MASNASQRNDEENDSMWCAFPQSIINQQSEMSENIQESLYLSFYLSCSGFDFFSINICDKLNKLTLKWNCTVSQLFESHSSIITRLEKCCSLFCFHRCMSHEFYRNILHFFICTKKLFSFFPSISLLSSYKYQKL